MGKKKDIDGFVVTLGGDKVVIRLSIVSCRYAEKYHSELVDLEILKQGLSSPATFAKLVWVGLLHADKTVQEDHILEMLLLESNANKEKIIIATGKAILEVIEEMKLFGEGATEAVESQEATTNGAVETTTPKTAHSGGIKDSSISVTS